MSYFGAYLQKALVQSYLRWSAPQLFTFRHSNLMPINPKIVIFHNEKDQFFIQK